MLRHVLLLAFVVGCSSEGAIDVDSASRSDEDAGASNGADDDADGNEPFGGGRGEYYDEVDDHVDRLLATGVAYAEFFCVCEENATSGPDFEACIDRYVTPVPPPILACAKEVYSHSQEALEVMGCELDSAEQYIECLQVSTCTDFDHITMCETDRIIREFDCEQLPYDAWAQEQVRCYGLEVEPPFECNDGEQIDPALVCDFADDCEDGSDEEQDCMDPHAGLDL